MRVGNKGKHVSMKLRTKLDAIDQTIRGGCYVQEVFFDQHVNHSHDGDVGNACRRCYLQALPLATGYLP